MVSDRSGSVKAAAVGAPPKPFSTQAVRRMLVLLGVAMAATVVSPPACAFRQSWLERASLPLSVYVRPERHSGASRSHVPVREGPST